MSTLKKPVILIGMPASGKSTVGRLAAQTLGCPFLDSDRVMEQQEGRALHSIIETEGNDGFLRMEEALNLRLGREAVPGILATGGSAIYSRAAMEQFRSLGTVVYLQLGYETVRERLGDFALRGVIAPEGCTLRRLYTERCALCEGYADLTIPEREDETIESAAAALCTALKDAGLVNRP